MAVMMCVCECNVLPYVLPDVPLGFIFHSSSVLMVKAVIPVINGQWYKIVVRFYELSCKLDAGARKCGHCVYGEWQWLWKWTCEVCPQGPAGWQMHKPSQDAHRHLNLLMCSCKYTLSLFPSHRLSHSIQFLSFFQCKWFIVSFCLTYASLKLISGRYADPSGGAVDLYRWNDCFQNDLKSLIEKGNCHDFLMHLFVCLLLGTNILFWLWMQLHIMD